MRKCCWCYYMSQAQLAKRNHGDDKLFETCFFSILVRMRVGAFKWLGTRGERGGDLPAEFFKK